MATVSDLVADVQAEMWGMVAPRLNTLGASYTSGGVSVTLTYDPVGLAPGRFLAIEDEVLLVLAVSGKTLTVVGAQLGTTAANHSANVLVEIAPRFPRARIVRTLRQEILSWPDGLYYEDNVEINGVQDVRGYQLVSPQSDALDVLDVRINPETGDTSKSWKPVPFRFDRNANTTDFASGKAIIVTDTVEDLASRTLRVTLARPYVMSTFTVTTDLVTTCKIPEPLHEAAVWGALWRLLSVREAKRSNTESQPAESRIAEEVAAGSALQASLAYKSLRDARLREETHRLARRRPWGF